MLPRQLRPPRDPGRIAGGTYRVGGTAGVKGAAVRSQFDPAAYSIGRNEVGFLGIFDLYPEEGDEARARIAQATGSRPIQAGGDASIIFSMPTDFDEADPLQASFIQDGLAGGLTVLTAAVDTLDLEGDRFQNGAYSANAPPPVWNQPTGYSYKAATGVGGLPSLPGAMSYFTRWGENLFPEVAAGGAWRDLRMMASGRRFLAIWLYGWWMDARFETTNKALGYPVQWRVVRRPAPEPRLTVYSWPLMYLATAGNPLPATAALGPILDASPEQYRIGSVVMPGAGGGYTGWLWAARDYQTAGPQQKVTLWGRNIFGGVKPDVPYAGTLISLTGGAVFSVASNSAAGFTLYGCIEGVAPGSQNVCACVSAVRSR